MGLIKEFKEFAMKGNVMDMAVGIIIGGAFGKIVASLVGDIIMPVVGAFTGGGSLGSQYVWLSGLDRTFAQVTRSVSEDGAGFRVKSSLTLRVTMVELLAFFAKVRSRPG